jgi:voltage-gated potassium channel
MAQREREPAIERLVIAQRRRQQRDLRQFVRRLTLLFGALFVLVFAGSVAFAAVGHTSLAYGLVRTLDTITTLGSIPAPPSTSGRLVVIALELLGIGTLFYGLATVTEFFVSGQLSGVRDQRRIQRMIDSYSEHHIICGFGRVGRQIARDLAMLGAHHVVIDTNPMNREYARSEGIPYLEGNAADDDVLLEAGIERAAAVIACVDNDAENIFVTLSARELNAKVLIVARASAEDSEKKLLRAGADRVISPYRTTGREMARIALHPQVDRAVDVSDFRVEQIEVPASSTGAGKTVADVRGTSVIVALRRGDGRFEPQPAATSVIGAGDRVIALGTPESLERLEDIFQPASE